MSPRRADPPAAETGFTLLELVVVMGILSGFLVMLVQLVDAGLSLFGEGEVGQQLADRTSQVRRVLRQELQALRGAADGRDREHAPDRLVVQSLPIGLPARPEPQPTMVQVLRGAVSLPPERELPLLEALLRARLLQQAPDLPPAERETRLAALQAAEPLRGVGNLLLLPWRQEGADDAILELRAGWFLPGQLVPLDEQRFVDPFEVPVPGSPELPTLLVHGITTPILQNLLHVEFLFWSQATRSWADGGGAERLWDSARGGWLTDPALGGVWELDRGPGSLTDPTDDVQPHAVLVRAVVAQPAELPPEGLLDQPVFPDDTSLRLVQGSRFPGAPDGGFVKVGPEWIGYDARDGDFLTGLRRGLRGTRPRQHAAGARVQVGKSTELLVPLPHGRDSWNG